MCNVNINVKYTVAQEVLSRVGEGGFLLLFIIARRKATPQAAKKRGHLRSKPKHVLLMEVTEVYTARQVT